MIGRWLDWRDRRSVFGAVFVATLLLSCPSGSILGNEAQGRICRAGLGFGQAEARTWLFGRAFRGRIPADQSVAIATNLRNATAEIGAAEALFFPPFSTDPSRRQAVARVIADVGRFPAASAGDSYPARSAKIHAFVERYGATLGYTYVSSRPDALQAQATCDSLLFKACYFYGRATIASVIDDAQSRDYEAAAVGGFRASVQNGLAIAMDAAGHTPASVSVKKICCTFGTPMAWEAMRPLERRNALATYAQLEPVLLAIIDGAEGLDPVCSSREQEAGAGPLNGECYAENRNIDLRGLRGRVLSGAMIPDDPAMTVQKCVSYCGARGFALAGLQFGRWCFCGDSPGTRASNCDMPCSGNPGQICGGSYANSVYSTR